MRSVLPQQFKIVEGIANLTDGGVRTSDYVDMSQCSRAWCIATILGGGATAVTLQPYNATSAAGGSEAAITNAQNWWLNNATATTDTLVKQTAATAWATAATAVNHMIVGEIDPALLADGKNWVCVKTAGADASNLVSVVWLLETIYPQATPPTAIA